MSSYDKRNMIIDLRDGHAGIKRWNRKRQDHVASIDLTDADFSGVDLQGANLNAVNLTDSNLSSSILDGVDLENADLSRSHAGRTSFIGSKLVGTQFQEADLTEARFKDAKVSGANFQRAILKGVEFIGCDMASAHFEGATEIAAEAFQQVNLEGAQFSNTKLNRIVLCGARLRDASFQGANLNGADFSSATLINAVFTNAQLDDAILNECNLEGGKFDNAHLQRAQLFDVKVNSDTVFQQAEVEGCKIDHYTLESLKEYGGLTTGDRMDMDIRNDLAKLRASYSGFLGVIHLGALVAFLYPYVYFLLTQWGGARFFRVDETSRQTIALWEALLRYIVNGGVGWRRGWSPSIVAIATFLGLLGYNTLRGVLLFKTKKLEWRQETDGLPVRSSLVGGWARAYRAAAFLFWGNVLLILYHTYHFMTQRIML